MVKGRFSAPDLDQTPAKAENGRMTIEFQCPRCRVLIQVADDAQGQKGYCPQCQGKVRVPVVAPSSDSTSSSAAGSTSFAPTAMAIEFRCPRCTATMHAPATAAGQKGNCPQCGAKVRVPAPAIHPTRGAPPPMGGEATVDSSSDMPDVQFQLKVSELTAKQLASRGRGSILPLIVPTLFVLAFAAVAVYLVQSMGDGLSGNLNGVQIEDTELGTVPLDPVQIGKYKTLSKCLNLNEATVSTGLMSLKFKGSSGVMYVQPMVTDASAFVLVNLSGLPAVKEFEEKHREAMETARAAAIKKAAPEFLQAMQKRCAAFEMDDKLLFPYRNTIGVASLVRGFGYHLQATVDGEGYPCIFESESVVYFALPKGVQKFVIVGRDVAEGEKFPGKITVTVTKPAPVPMRTKKKR